MLFDNIIFGPIQSRRLGVSLGVNLLLPTAKLCNFDCIYCECGWNYENKGGAFNSKEDTLHTLEAKLQEMSQEGVLPDYITFAGNGEPTMHPEFKEIIEGVVQLRERYAPRAKVAVLSNATMIHNQSVREALGMIDRAILKFDSALDETYKLMNKPNSSRSVAQIVELLRVFNGEFVMQTMFLRGNYQGVHIDNTTEGEVTAWLEVVAELRPREVMLYSIDRPTPHNDLQKVDKSELERIALRVRALGIEAIVS